MPIAEKMQIHHLMLTLQHRNLRYHDQRMGFDYASSTLMQKIMIQKSVSMTSQRQSQHHKGTHTLKDDLKLIIWMKSEEQSQKIIIYIKEVILSRLSMKNQQLRATKESTKISMQEFKNFSRGDLP